MKDVLRVRGVVGEEAGTPAPMESADPMRQARHWSWIDEVLAESFPASDPPSWTLGVARPNPTSAAEPLSTADGAAAVSTARSPPLGMEWVVERMGTSPSNKVSHSRSLRRSQPTARNLMRAFVDSR